MITFPLPQLAKQNVQPECLILSCRFQLGMLLLTRETFFTIEVLLIFHIGISHLGYVCKNMRTECTRGSHTGSHKINPSSTWDFPWSLYHRIISSHLTFNSPSQQEFWVRLLRNETPRYFLNKGGISDTYSFLPWWKPSAIIEKKVLSESGFFVYSTMVWLSLDGLENKGHRAPLVLQMTPAEMERAFPVLYFQFH